MNNITLRRLQVKIRTANFDTRLLESVHKPFLHFGICTEKERENSDKNIF